ncbi:MAG: hypothetical protein JXX29_03690 [Deltaproteobacteria bacterium]|nr:hypothetical protein [Deltaproteobacteria bacterium]MBN2670745.1 hypothetical protein [Deltaproteobacteria bacterium]
MRFVRYSFLSLVVFWACSLGVQLLPRIATAQQAPIRKVGVSSNDSQLLVTFGYRDVFTQKIQEKLKSGLPTRLVVQVAVENENGKQVAFWARTVHVVYDLWEEHFIVTLKEPGGKRATKVKTVREVMQAAGVLWRTRIAWSMPPGKYRLKVGVEANPVSEKMVRNIQRWISKPSGGFQNAGTGTSYFGSFVGYFVDRNIAKAEKSIRFVSQWFEL